MAETLEGLLIFGVRRLVAAFLCRNVNRNDPIADAARIEIECDDKSSHSKAETHSESSQPMARQKSRTDAFNSDLGTCVITMTVT
jgi:hypothetical protein